ncbi:hypothetical protein SDC9_191610 [bioreactor metagenome]|uniref:Uncharacterized protein n=1 Tax=bioreactor metagenome TaxID=1076179 RepID=A0A645I0S9_9ZZZZ
MMEALSTLRSPRSVNWPCSSRACRSPETLTWRSARTSTCSLLALACRFMLRPDSLPVPGGVNWAYPVPVSWPPSSGARVRLPLYPRMRAWLPLPPLRRSSVMSSLVPCSLARRMPSRRSTPSSRDTILSPSALISPCHLGSCKVPLMLASAASVP